MNSRARHNLGHRIVLGALLAGYAASVLAQTPKPALLVLNKADSNLAIVDPATGKIAAKVPTGEQPHEVAVSADGKLAFVTNYGPRGDGNTISVIDLAAQRELHRVDISPLRGPHGVASADGKLAFVTNYGPRGDGNTISVIDLAAQRELHRVDISPLRGPHGVASADGKAYFTAEVSKVIARYDPAENKLDWLMGTGQNVTHMVVLTPDLGTIFVVNIGSNSVSAIEKSNARGGWNATVIPVGKGPEGSSLSPDGRELWVANS